MARIRATTRVIAGLADYRGKTLLVVNVASECGFTPHHGVRELTELIAKLELSAGRTSVVIGEHE